MSISSSLEDELLLFPHGTVPAVSVIHSRLRDLYPSFGLDVCNVVKLTFSKCISPASPQNSNNRFFNFLTRFKKNSDFIYYLVVAKSIGYNKKVLNLYRLNVKEKLKSKNGVLPSFVNKSEGKAGYSVPRLRGQTHRSQEAMKFNGGNGAKSRHSLHQGGSRISVVQVSSRRERRVSVGKNDDFRKSEDFDGLQMAFDAGLKVSDAMAHSNQTEKTVQSLNSSLGAGDPLFSSPKTTPKTTPNHSALPSRINSVSQTVMTPNSSSENLSSVRKQSSEQTTKSSIVDDAYSSAGSDSGSDDEDTSYYVGLELISKFDPKVLIDAEINSPLAGRRRVSTNTRNDRSDVRARCSNSNVSSQNSRRKPEARSPRRRSASATRNRNVSDIQDSLKVNLNDTIFKFRNKDDVVELFRAVFD